MDIQEMEASAQSGKQVNNALAQGLNPCLLHWQADSLPLSHQGSPYKIEVEAFGWDRE